MKSKNLILIVLLLFGTINASAQLKTEPDGFVWEKFEVDGKVGAKDKNGKVIIEPKFESIFYSFNKDKNVSVGYFTVWKYTGNKHIYGIFDITGTIRFPIKNEYAHLYVKMCGSDTLAFISSSNITDEKRTIYDIDGKKIARIPGYSAEDDGYFYNFKTKENLNIRIPLANGKLSKFYVRNDHSYRSKLNGSDVICDADGNIIVPPGKYDRIYECDIFEKIYYKVEKNGKVGVCDVNGVEIIPPKYDNIVQSENDGYIYYRVELNGKNGACDINGTEIIPPMYDRVYYSGGNWRCSNEQKVEEPKPTEGQRQQPQYASSNSHTEDYSSTQSSSYTSAYSSSANKEYKPLSDPNLIDNSEKIKDCEKEIEELENKRHYCSSCNGTHKVPTYCFMCRGTGTVKVGFYTPQYFACSRCGGTGRRYDPCSACQQTAILIAASKNYLKSLRETHGMTKEAREFYLKQKAFESEIQESIYSSSSSSSSNQSSSGSSSKSTCTYCNGTGYDPIAWGAGSINAGDAGGRTNSAGTKCSICGSTTWHQHRYCPKCNSSKWR